MNYPKIVETPKPKKQSNTQGISLVLLVCNLIVVLVILAISMHQSVQASKARREAEKAVRQIEKARNGR